MSPALESIGLPVSAFRPLLWEQRGSFLLLLGLQTPVPRVLFPKGSTGLLKEGGAPVVPWVFLWFWLLSPLPAPQLPGVTGPDDCLSH